MPVFQDPDHQKYIFQPWLPSQSPSAISSPKSPRRPAHGTVEDGIMNKTVFPESNMESSNRPGLQTSSREELIRSIKNGESPTWVPNRALEEYFATHGDSPHERLEERQKRKSPPLLPAADIRKSPKRERIDIYGSPCNFPVDIERPRSALHSGDFREGSPEILEQRQRSPSCEDRHFHTPLETPWYTSTKETCLESSRRDGLHINHGQPEENLSRSRAPSLGSLPSSYVLKPPTSPLVYQSNNPDLDFSLKSDPMDISTSSERINRRRTLPPEAFQYLPSSPPVPSNHTTKFFGQWGRDKSLPYQAHQPRRSVASTYTPQITSSPQSPDFIRSRRLSYTSEATPLHHASMVGSYEESILRGRMSTTPSKPLDFTAQIGVLGKGNCKPNLKCPSHVTVPFPAVFFSYPTSGGDRSISDDSPSPYVGFIDLEQSLPSERRPSQRIGRPQPPPRKCPCPHPAEEARALEQSLSCHQERRARERRTRRSQSPKSPPGGCYRIPQQGQLQIIIKNPNKTAVKLFLVPYDLDTMEPGTKTFIRQRSYSVDTAIGVTVDSTKSSDTDTAKPVLRYLIHLNICCPSRGRYYLYNGIRVVFANRVPDCKENLRNESQCPEPRYSPYNPMKESARFATEKTHRRRSTGFGITTKPTMRSIVSDPVKLSFNPTESIPYQTRFPHSNSELREPITFVSTNLFPDNKNTRQSPQPNKWVNKGNSDNLNTIDGLSVPCVESPPSNSLYRRPNNYMYQKALTVDTAYNENSRPTSPKDTSFIKRPPYTSNSSMGPETGDGLLARELRDIRFLRNDGAQEPR